MSRPSPITEKYLRALEEQSPLAPSSLNNLKRSGIGPQNKAMKSHAASGDPGGARAKGSSLSSTTTHRASVTVKDEGGRPSSGRGPALQVDTRKPGPALRLPKSISTPAVANSSLSTSLTGSVGPRPDRNPLMHNENLTPSQVSWENERKNWQAYEYLCHVVEAKEWVEKILGETLAPADEFPASLQNGVALAKITKVLRPELMKWPIFEHKRLQYRHTENITQFFSLLENLRIPQLFLFDMTDLYEKRNLPKVIYCIHAVSHYVAEQQTAFSAVEDLVGKLEFSDDQLLSTEKNIEGQSLPNFNAMTRKLSGKAPDIGALDLDEDTPGQPLHRSIEMDVDSNKDGALDNGDRERCMSSHQPYTPRSTKSSSSWSLDYITSDDDRDEELRVHRQRRPRRDSRTEPGTGRMFSPTYYNNRYSRHDSRGYGYRNLSSMTLLRKEALNTAQQILVELEALEPEIVKFQALCRRHLVDARFVGKINSGKTLLSATPLQALIRGSLVRRRMCAQNAQILHHTESVKAVQAHFRAYSVRNKVKGQLQSAQEIVKIQSIVRGITVRQLVSQLKADLSDATSTKFITLQAIGRAKVFRRHYFASADGANNLMHFQGLARGVLVRRAMRVTQARFRSKNTLKSIVSLQSVLRGTIARYKVECLYTEVDRCLDTVLNLQSLCHSRLQSRRLDIVVRGWEAHASTIVKIQSVYRTKLQGRHYKMLMTAESPSLSSLRPFLHLIEDSPKDYEQVLDLEKVAKENKEIIHEILLLEGDLRKLNTKVHLLSKNKVNMDELIFSEQRKMRDLMKEHKAQARAEHQALKSSVRSTISDSGDSFDMSLLQSSSQKRCELYGCLLYILQTQPFYTRVLMGLNSMDSSSTSRLVFSVFGQAQMKREKYFLLKLLEQSITSSTVGDAENTVCWEIVSFLNEDTASSAVLKAILRKPCERVQATADHPLFYDPHAIWQYVTGEDLPAATAIQEPECKQVFVKNLQILRDIVTSIMQELTSNLSKLPYHILFLAKQVLKRSLEATRSPIDAVSAAAQVVISQFLYPALISVDRLELVDTAVGHNMTNLKAVSRILHQIGVMLPFNSAGGSSVFLKPLDKFVKNASNEFATRLESLLKTVPELTAHYNITDADDYTAHDKPHLRIATANLYKVHHICYERLGAEIAEIDTVLKPLLEELGPVYRDENLAQSQTLNLELNQRFCTSSINTNNGGLAPLMATAKRYLGYLLQVQNSAPDLMSVLVADVTLEDEVRYNNLLERENVREAAGDLALLNFRELKLLTLEKILELESSGAITRKDGYQSVINLIAEDIKNKDVVRHQRLQLVSREKRTNDQLIQKRQFLNTRIESYRSEIRKRLMSLQSSMVHEEQASKGKLFKIPNLKSNNEITYNMPQFGRYRASADKLFEKGILVKLMDYGERQRKDVYLTFNSHEVEHFDLEVAYKTATLPNGHIRFTLDDLLEKQHQDVACVNYMDGVIQFRTHRLVRLIFRKFFGTE